MNSQLPSSVRTFDELVSLFDYDRAAPLRMDEVGSESRDGVSIHDLSYASLGDGRVQAYWVAPSGEGLFPCVIFVHPAPGNRSTFLEEAILLGQRGIASLLVEAPWAQGESWGRTLGTPEHDRQVFIDITKDLRRGLDFIASRPEADASRAAYVGHSFGALFGGVLSGVEKRLGAFVLMAGAPSFTDLVVLNLPFLQGEALEQYAQGMEPIDPIYYVQRAAPAALFFQFGQQDEAFSSEVFERYARAGSQPKLIRWYDTGHYFQNSDARRDRLEWLQMQLVTQSADAPIRRALSVQVPIERAFEVFTRDLAAWWPPEFTWAADVLETIAIEPRQGGRCFERGPHGFQCDWGRVLVWDPPGRLVFTWQISPRREPEPNPARASEVELRLTAQGPEATRIEFEHRGFARHGAGAWDYRAALNAPEGWTYILGRYAAALGGSLAAVLAG